MNVEEPKIVRGNEVIDSNQGPIVVREIFSNEMISFATVKLDGVNKTTRNKTSDSFYYVQEGEGIFNIDGNEIPVSKGDAVFIPKNTPYFDSGKMTLNVVCTPKFDKDEVEVAE